MPALFGFCSSSSFQSQAYSANIWRMKIRLLLCLLFLLPLQVFAADKWTSVRSSDFTVVGNATEAQLRSTAVELEQFRDAFTQFLSLPARPATINTTVIVFKNDESYGPFEPLGADGKPAVTAGYFQSSEDTNYMA